MNSNDFVTRYIRSIVQLGVYFASGATLNIVPVNFAADMITRVSTEAALQASSQQTCVYVLNPRQLSYSQLGELVRKFGFPHLRSLEYNQWRKLLIANPPPALLPLLFIFQENGPALSALEQIDFAWIEQLPSAMADNFPRTCPPPDERLLQLYIKAMV